MDISKGIKAIQTKAAKELSFPLVPKFWDIIKKDVGSEEDYFDGDPEGYENYLEAYQGVVDRHIAAFKTVPPYIRAKPSIDKNQESPQPKKRYRKCFERRFYLVDFVVDKGIGSNGNRIDWKRTVAEWNKAHPSDTMSLPVLKAEYYRAIQEAPLYLQMGVTLAVKIAKDYQQVRQQIQEDSNLAPATKTETLKKLNDGYRGFYGETVMYIFQRFQEMGFTGRFLTSSLLKLSDSLLPDEQIESKQVIWELLFTTWQRNRETKGGKT